MKVGEIVSCNKEIILNKDKESRTIKVSNIGDRPIQVGSHYHFFEVNALLVFPRQEAFGFHLDIPSGTSVRFEPGETKEIDLVRLGGKKLAYGGNDLVCGSTEAQNLAACMERAQRKNMLLKTESGVKR